MATTVMAPRRRSLHPDRIFYPAMCLLVLATVYVGFSRTYFTAGMLHAPLPNTLIHVHAVAFTLWILTLITQIALVSAHRLRLHMTVGLWGFGLAAVMLVLGTMAATDALRRNFSGAPGMPATTFYVVPLSDMFNFALLAGGAYLLRRKPAAHKRLILLATINLCEAAIDRFPIVFGPMNHWAVDGILYSFVAVMLIYDLVSRRRLHPATVFGSLLIVGLNLTRIPMAQTAAWQHFALWLKG